MARAGAPRIPLALLELALMAAAVLLDLLIPSLVVVVIGAAFVLLRGERMPFHGPQPRLRPARFVLTMLGWALAWTAVQYGLLLPLQNRLLHGTRDVGAFAAVQGNLPSLLLLLLASWTLAALGEEFALRGFFHNRAASLFRDPAKGIVVAVVSAALLFGALHAEQGIVGIAAAALDGAFFSFVRVRYRSVWASVLVHGFLNTVGLVAFYFAGPLYGLW